MRNASTIRSTVRGLTRVQGVWTGGGAAASCTKAAADHNDGILGVAYNVATGKYKVAFSDVGQQIVFADCKVCGLTGVPPVTANVLRGTYDRAAKTVEVEFYDLAGALIDLLVTDKVLCVFEMSNFAPDT